MMSRCRPHLLLMMVWLTLLLVACSREYNTELMNAAKNGDLDAVEAILERGADINQQNNKGKTALMFAASEGHADVARLLLAREAEVDIPDNYGTTALIVAATGGYDEIVAMLLEHGADPSIHDESGSGALVNAVYFGRTRSVELLLPRLMPLDKQDGEELLLLAAGLGHDVIVRDMVEAGINVNGRGLKNRTALMAAAAFDKPEVVRVLLQLGADIELRDEDGNSVFDVAKDYGNEDVVDVLNAAKESATQMETGN